MPRFETSFDLRLSELAILVTAATQRSNTEWTIHKGEALNAGGSMRGLPF